MDKPMMPMFDHRAFRALSGQAQQDYRTNYRNDLRSWVQALTGHANPATPATPAVPGATPATPATPAQPYVAPPLPQAPLGMIGSSYGVQGMTPATSAFGLPHY